MVPTLLSQVESTAKITVRTRGDCERLSALILEHTDRFISYNTLRRLYGLAPGGTPQRKTLDVLAVFCGFKHYPDYCVRNHELNAWELRGRLHTLLTTGQAEQLVEFFEPLSPGPMKLDLLLMASRELVLGRRWLDLALMLERHTPAPYDYTYQLHFALSLGQLLFNGPHRPPDALLLQPALVDSVYLRLIDCSSLNGDYGRWTDLLKTRPTSPETAIFVACIDQLRAFLNCKPLPPFEIAIDPRTAYPVALVGRVYSVLRMRNPEADLDRLWEELLRKMPPEDDSLSIYIEPSTWAVVAGDMALADWLCRRVRVNEAMLQEFQRHDLHVHYLLQSMRAVWQANWAEAQEVFRLFTPDQIRSPSFRPLLHFAIRRIEVALGTTSVLTTPTTLGSTPAPDSPSGMPPDVRATLAPLGHAWFSDEKWRTFFD
jgi:hypothetical protein